MIETRLMRVRDPRDREFVVPTWVKSYADVAMWPKRMVLDSHWKVVDALLEDEATRVVLLCSTSNENALHGWAAVNTDAGALHWAYVPPDLRGKGLARRVIAAALGDYPDPMLLTHPTRTPLPRTRLNPYPTMRSA